MTARRRFTAEFALADPGFFGLKADHPGGVLAETQTETAFLSSAKGNTGPPKSGSIRTRKSSGAAAIDRRQEQSLKLVRFNAALACRSLG